MGNLQGHTDNDVIPIDTAEVMHLNRDSHAIHMLHELYCRLDMNEDLDRSSDRRRHTRNNLNLF